MNEQSHDNRIGSLLVVTIAVWLGASVTVAAGVAGAVTVALDEHLVAAAAILAATFALFSALQRHAFHTADRYTHARRRAARRQRTPQRYIGRHACDSATRTFATVPARGGSR